MTKETEESNLNGNTIFYLSLFLGWFGIDRFYAKKIGSGFLKLLTLSGFGIWWFIDIILILSGKFKDSSGKVVKMRGSKVVPAICFVLLLGFLCLSVLQENGKENVTAEEEKKISSFTDSRDGKTYKAVEIGTQTWMAENLNYEVKGSICYNDDPAYCEKYGRLYDWATAMKLPVKCNSGYCTKQVENPHRGICPEGWHLPNREEWQTLVDFAGGKEYVRKKLKAKTGWNNYEGQTGNGTDNYGFAALPGGAGCKDYKQYCIPGDIGIWLGTTESICEGCSKDAVQGKDAFGLLLPNKNAYKTVFYKDISISVKIPQAIMKVSLYSVRCVKD